MNDKQIYLEEIGNKDSSYFAGSACLLSLLPLLKAYFSCLHNEQIYNYTEELVMTLSKEDGELFSLSLSKDELTEEQEKFLETAFDHYRLVLSLLVEIIQDLNEEDKEKEAKFFVSHYQLLSHLCLINIEAFEKRENPPSFLKDYKLTMLVLFQEEVTE